MLATRPRRRWPRSRTKRATFTRANVLAEAAPAAARGPVRHSRHGPRRSEDVTGLALDAAVAAHPGRRLAACPAELRRSDGTSRFRARDGVTYTTQETLAAEERLLDAGRNRRRAAGRRRPGRGRRRAPDSRPGTRCPRRRAGRRGRRGRHLRAASSTSWSARPGPGSPPPWPASAPRGRAVYGPGVRGRARAVRRRGGGPRRRRRGADREHRQMAQPSTPASPTGRPAGLACRPGWPGLPLAGDPATEPPSTPAAARVRPLGAGAGQLVIVDEASMAATDRPRLDHHGRPRQAGAKVLLVGDWAQLSPVQAGGAFKLLADRPGRTPPSCTTCAGSATNGNATPPWNCAPGGVTAADTYARPRPGRVGGAREDMLDLPFDGWRTDTEAGRTALMVAADADDRHRPQRPRPRRPRRRRPTSSPMAATARRRHHDRASATGRHPPEPPRPDGPAGGWVKNGDTWTLTTPRTGRVRSPDPPRTSRQFGRLRDGCRPTTSPNTSSSATPPPPTAPRAAP